MKNCLRVKLERAQSLVELAYTMPLILLIMLGAIEVVFYGRAYLAILEATVVSSRLGSSGAAFYDNDEILTMTRQVLSEEGYDSSDLVDIIITRANIVNGSSVENYQVSNMMHSGRSSHITSQLIQNRVRSGDPSLSIIGVEVLFDHHLLFDMSQFLPDPLVISAFSINALPG